MKFLTLEQKSCMFMCVYACIGEGEFFLFTEIYLVLSFKFHNFHARIQFKIEFYQFANLFFYTLHKFCIKLYFELDYTSVR